MEVFIPILIYIMYVFYVMRLWDRDLSLRNDNCNYVQLAFTLDSSWIDILSYK
jgi:hypothetical protein